MVKWEGLFWSLGMVCFSCSVEADDIIDERENGSWSQQVGWQNVKVVHFSCLTLLIKAATCNVRLRQGTEHTLESM